MSTLFVGHFVQFFDDNGDPLSSGEVTFYEPGTSTKKDVYTDSDLSVPSDNPVTLDSAGRATVWLNGDYKARLEDSTGSLVEETDNINPPVTTETTGGNLVANGSFETQGNASTDADGWTLTAQSDGTVERITADNYDGEASLKFTSLGNGGGQADTNSFFAVSPGRQYEVSFALKCSVADIRNIVQVRYFDEDQSFLSNSTVYDEDTSNPTSWELKSFSDTPPANARFAKLRILGADQSDSTAGEAKFDSVTIAQERLEVSRFPNVNDDVTATDEELNKTDGITGQILTSGNDGPVYTGFITAAASFIDGPSGWTVANPATGKYVITHNLNLSTQSQLIASINVTEHGIGNLSFGLYSLDDASTDKDNAAVFIRDHAGNNLDRAFQFIFINQEET